MAASRITFFFSSGSLINLSVGISNPTFPVCVSPSARLPAVRFSPVGGPFSPVRMSVFGRPNVCFWPHGARQMTTCHHCNDNLSPCQFAPVRFHIFFIFHILQPCEVKKKFPINKNGAGRGCPGISPEGRRQSAPQHVKRPHCILLSLAIQHLL